MTSLLYVGLLTVLSHQTLESLESLGILAIFRILGILRNPWESLQSLEFLESMESLESLGILEQPLTILIIGIVLDHYYSRSAMKFIFILVSNSIRTNPYSRAGLGFKIQIISHLCMDCIALESIYQKDQNFCSFSFQFVRTLKVIETIAYAVSGATRLL